MTFKWIPRRVRRLGRLVLFSDARRDALHEWRRRRRGEPEIPPGVTRNVLVVCYGNICRSPFAGELLAIRRPDLQVRSVGLAARDGAPAEPEAIRAARVHRVDLDRHAARAMNADDAAWADLILVMEGHQAARIARRWPGGVARTRLLGDFLADPPHAIRDPWGQADEVFLSTFRRIEAAIHRLSVLIEKGR